MRVLTVSLVSGGIGRYGALYAAAVSRHLQESGHNCKSVITKECEAFCEVSTEQSHIKLTIDFQRSTKISALFNVIRLYFSYRPDIVNDTSGSSSLLSCMLLPLYKIFSLVVTVEHDPLPHLGMKSWKKALSSWLIRTFSNRVIVHGTQSRHQAVTCGFNPARLRVVHHGELGVYGRIGVRGQREKNTVLFFGAFRPNKGFDYILDIAQHVQAHVPEVRFVIAGSKKLSSELLMGPWAQTMENHLSKMKCSSIFEVYDTFIPDELVANIFDRCCVTILPYRDATQSGVAAMALAFGTVPIATAVGDLPEVVIHNKTGLVSNCHANEIANNVVFLLLNDRERERLSNEAIRFASDELSWSKVAQSVSRIYSELLN